MTYTFRPVYNSNSFNSLNFKRLKTALCFLLCLMVLSGCSVHRKVPTSTRDQIKAEKKIEKEVEKHLRGQEKKVIEEAFEWLGTPYVYARQDKGVATDCSGFVMRVFEKAISCNLPRNSTKQAEFCKPVARKNVKAGDLVFFITGNGETINHVGIMIDDTQFIHASSSKGVVVSTMDNNYYIQRFKMYGRVPCLHHD